MSSVVVYWISIYPFCFRWRIRNCTKYTNNHESKLPCAIQHHQQISSCMEWNTTIKAGELETELKNLESSLRINKKSLSKYKRSMTSSPDDRVTSLLIGLMYFIVLCGFAITFLVLDILHCYKQASTFRKKMEVNELNNSYWTLLKPIIQWASADVVYIIVYS